MSGFQGNNLKAIRVAGAKGDITGTEAILVAGSRQPYVPSPLLYEGILYLLKSNTGMLPLTTPAPESRISRCSGCRPRRKCLPLRSVRQDGYIYPHAMGRRSSSSTARRSKRWRRRSCRTGSMRLRRWSIGRSTCGAIKSVCIADRDFGGDGDTVF